MYLFLIKGVLNFNAKIFCLFSDCLFCCSSKSISFIKNLFFCYPYYNLRCWASYIFCYWPLQYFYNFRWSFCNIKCFFIPGHNLVIWAEFFPRFHTMKNCFIFLSSPKPTVMNYFRYFFIHGYFNSLSFINGMLEWIVMKLGLISEIIFCALLKKWIQQKNWCIS